MTSLAQDVEHLIEPEDPLSPVELADLPEWIGKAARKAGWTRLSPVQRYAIPYMLEGRDMMVQARTGSGKTGAFVLPMMEKIDPALKAAQALVLVPTRELAVQVMREAERLGGESGVHAVAVYGGVSYGPQLQAFRQGAQLVVGTPGRILDHLMRKSLSFQNLQTLVFDEADRMLSMGFYPDMLQLKRFLPGTQNGFMFSATYPATVRSLAKQFLRNPGFLSLSKDSVHVADTDHIYYEVGHMDKDRALVRIIEAENPNSALIFCNKKVRVNYIATVLKRFGFDADQITSDLSQKARERVMDKMRAKELRFLVATDVAARGIDIPRMSHVFQYDLPEDREIYIHRAGRTGRAGASGIAITLVDPIETGRMKLIARSYEITMEQRDAPTEQEVQQIVSERVTAHLEAKLRSLDRLHAERLKRFEPLTEELSQSQEGRRLLALLLDEYYREEQHKPEEMPPVTATAEKGKKKSPAEAEERPKTRGRRKPKTEKKEAASKTAKATSPKEEKKPSKGSRRAKKEPVTKAASPDGKAMKKPDAEQETQKAGGVSARRKVSAKLPRRNK